MKNKIGYLLLCSLFVMSGDHRSKLLLAEIHPKKYTATPIISKTIKAVKEILPKKSIIIPAGYQVMHLNKTSTTEIGTIDHPTINGGIINSHESAAAVNYQDESAAGQISPANTTPPFDDHWIAKSSIRTVLNKAIQDGKLDYILRESEKRKLPASLALIPLVESNYQDTVVSEKGAAGAWQIMPSLAREFHLSLTKRFDFKESTATALDYLQQLHHQFGNWELAFAAYNAGPHRVMGALRKNPQATAIQDLSLPLETKAYLAKIKSIHRILSDLPGEYAHS